MYPYRLGAVGAGDNLTALRELENEDKELEVEPPFNNSSTVGSQKSFLRNWAHHWVILIVNPTKCELFAWQTLIVSQLK